MNSDSFVHKRLLQLYPEYAELDSPDDQLQFFLNLPCRARQSIKAAAVRERGVGPHRLLLNDPQVDTQTLCCEHNGKDSKIADSKNNTTSRSAALSRNTPDAHRPKLHALITFHNVPFTSNAEMHTGDQAEGNSNSNSTLDAQIIQAYRRWHACVLSSPYICIPGPALEVVGFLTDKCLDDELCVFSVTDLYDYLVVRGEQLIKGMFSAKFPLDCVVSIDADTEKSTIQNVPKAREGSMASIDMDELLAQFRVTIRQLRMWLLSTLHSYVLAMIQSDSNGIVAHIPNVLIIREEDEEDEASDESKNRTIILKSGTVAATIYLDEPFIQQAVNSNPDGDIPGELTTLLNTVTEFAEKGFTELCQTYIPLFPQGWA